ncbi:MAG TPA: 5-oxoprolinase subunit PxpB [Dokdonella sp.]|uniref:5-oxoprolinase subunit PxpB n=1 Tax=Dokdonella sp. TaxID=2291710 RepID=UPI002D807333|nr:5-oxoprolinase subunit PxpB [Dokdonella sp.]HET9032352.1 5-oxoprolinase subunit PxpB [Dokdonella sp.]
MSEVFAVETLGEDALLLRFGDAVDGAINQRVHACVAVLEGNRPAWLIDIVPAFATLALCIDLDAFTDAAEPLAELRRWLASQRFDKIEDERAEGTRSHSIRVRYGGEFGPDLEAVAAHAGLSAEEVIHRHSAAEYRVGMLGFAPGFPYLIGMHASLSMPRHATPRTNVSAGSVGIAGAQTGIYPRSGPGGWQIIGGTEEALFDAGRESPALLQPGDIVRFVDAAKVGGTAS